MEVRIIKDELDYIEFEKNGYTLRAVIPAFENIDEIDLGHLNQIVNDVEQVGVRRIIYEYCFEELLNLTVFHHYLDTYEEEDSVIAETLAFDDTDAYFGWNDEYHDIQEDCMFWVDIHKYKPSFEKPGDWVPSFHIKYFDPCGIEMEIFYIQSQYKMDNEQELRRVINYLNFEVLDGKYCEML